MAPQADVIVIGAGIVGLASAYELARLDPDLRILVLDKEDGPARHQTGHNSGVLHSGIYYKPGSLKASNCRVGKARMERFCAEEGIPYDICGKVIVALEDWELPILQRIFERGQANGVRCTMIGPERLRELEPYCPGIRALEVPEAGIVDFKQVCARLEDKLSASDQEVRYGARVQFLRRETNGWVVGTTLGDFHGAWVVNCAGLYCDKITKWSGMRPEAQIVPFRGEYYELKPEAEKFCRNLIYPVPDPAFPFLGVHFTRMVHGGVECGPNAVLAFAREGYSRWTVNPRELGEILAYPGFHALAWKFWPQGLGEMYRSFSKAAFVRALQRLIPDIRGEHLAPGGAGVRAQALRPDGSMVDDFLIQEDERIIHVNNAPSPAATSALNIGSTIAELVRSRMVQG
jgi:L-2-hydroxyglutarate oxidase